jgi:catechol 2,3-dioxygenase-like lactoylglutathione lyase family enzyme
MSLTNFKVEAMSIKIKNKMQTILFVKNMDVEVRFYRDILGLKITYPKGLEDYSKEMWVEFTLGKGSLALHGGADSKPDVNHEVVFWVENIQQAFEIIRFAGVQINEIRPLEGGAPIAEGRDPEGHRFAIRSESGIS